MTKIIFLILLSSSILFAANPNLLPATSTPANGATGVAVDANIIMAFDINIWNAGPGTGFELRKTSDDTLVEEFDATAPYGFTGNHMGTASIATSFITVNPNADLISGESYYILIPVGSNIGDDTSPDSVNSVTLKTTYAFTTALAPPPDVDFFALTSEDVNTTLNYPSANIAGDSIVFGDLNNTTFQKDWRVVYTLTNGAKFAEGNYTIEEWIGGAGTGDINDSNPVVCTTSGGCSTLDFLIVDTTDPTIRRYGLSGADIAGQAVNFVTPKLANGSTIDINVELFDETNASIDTASVQLFQYTQNLAPAAPTPTPTPEPEPQNEEVLKTDADEVESPYTYDGYEESDDNITVSYGDDGSDEKKEIVIPKIDGKTITPSELSDGIEFTMDDGVISYNNNGTTEAQVTVNDKNTTAVSYIPGAEVEFTEDGGVKTSAELENGSKVQSTASADGSSETSVTNSDGKSTESSTNIPGSQTVIKEDGTTEIDTPATLSDKGNEITTKTSVDVDGNVVLTGTKVGPDGTVTEVPLGNFEAGSEVKITYQDGAVVVEVITSLGTKAFTLRSGRK